VTARARPRRRAATDRANAQPGSRVPGKHPLSRGAACSEARWGSRNRNGEKARPSGQAGPPERWADRRGGEVRDGTPSGGTDRAGPNPMGARPGSPGSPYSVPRVRAAGRKFRGPGKCAGRRGARTPWACAVETHRRARRGASRQGREKRRRRTEAGMEPRDEARDERRGPSGASREARAGKWILRVGRVGGAANLRGGCPVGREGGSPPTWRTGPERGGGPRGRTQGHEWATPPTGQPAGWRSSGRHQGPRRKAERTQVEPRSHTSDYARSPRATPPSSSEEGKEAATR
jgi:hypothetical protein